VICHGLILEDRHGLALVDPGIGLLDVADPAGRLGREVIDLAGFQFDEADTAARKVEALGYKPTDVTDIVLTHADPDHAGGLADFPAARVHLSAEERANLDAPGWRYVARQFEHGPRWEIHGPSDFNWFGLEARPVGLGFGAEVFLIPLFGHTRGHCGVAIRQGDRWALHVGDAYYLRGELDSDDHPVGAVAALRADDDPARRRSIGLLRALLAEQADRIDHFGYHDPEEFPGA
jgi:glyoxylase-like metal-dependent hydrolase (beta-lactamase superfamily II)